MWHHLRRYSRNDAGAISADWMALSAGLIALSVIVVATIGTDAQDIAQETSTTFAQVTLSDHPQLPD
jgi:hypothetical protein